MTRKPLGSSDRPEEGSYIPGSAGKGGDPGMDIRPGPPQGQPQDPPAAPGETPGGAPGAPSGGRGGLGGGADAGNSSAGHAGGDIETGGIERRKP
ncbi:hypothetical protein [Arenibaculum pallidiluteum]|uniref:hypothetical protein n=1 Tax=Arenibaculum pallidiluteum TaxID=2812559 RepID=UPI001A97BE40|nr:hypothetical protein [Arenibaculum pallidiluteum]